MVGNHLEHASEELVIPILETLTIRVGSEETPVSSPLVCTTQLVADVAAPVTILSNDSQFVLAGSEHLTRFVSTCFLSHLL